MSIELVILSNHLIFCPPLLLLPSIFPSFGVFSSESALYLRWPKNWSLSFSISPSNEYSGLISFRIDWFDLLSVQVTLKSFLQHHNSKASILQHSAFFIVQLSHPYMTTGKTIALTMCTFVDKIMSLLFNRLSRFVIAFLPRTKCLLISWLQSPSTVILETNKLSLFPLFPHLFTMKWWDWMLWSLFFDCWILNQLFHSPLSLSSSAHISGLCQFFLTILLISTFNRPLFLIHPGLFSLYCDIQYESKEFAILTKQMT